MLLRRSLLPRLFALCVMAAFVSPSAAGAQRLPTGAQPLYAKAPAAIERVLDADPAPTLSLSTDRSTIALATALRYPPIAVESRPFLRLAGLRIDPENNAAHRAVSYKRIAFQRITESKPFLVITSPNSSTRLSDVRWSRDGRYAAYMSTDTAGVRLTVVDLPAKSVQVVPNLRLNPVLLGPRGVAFSWMPDSRRLLVRSIGARGRAPASVMTPTGPVIQESSGKLAAARTYEDLLTTPQDEAQFEYYATSQLAMVDAAKLSVRPIGPSALFDEAMPSPSGAYLLVSRRHRPFSYALPLPSFPQRVEVWNTSGAVAKIVVDQGLADRVPLDGEVEGPRDISWRPNEPATLEWVVALDKGDTDAAASVRDALESLPEPFTAAPHRVVAIPHRFVKLQYAQDSTLALLTEHQRSTRLSRTYLVDVAATSPALKLVSTLRDGDRYNDPGKPATVRASNGDEVALRDGDDIFVIGDGVAREGRRPFVDRLNLTTLVKQRVFVSDLQPLETPVAVLDSRSLRFLATRTSRSEPVNYVVRDGQAERALTAFVDPNPDIRAITRKLVTYKRPDGVDLSFTMYLPPNYVEGTRLPTLLWAYPLEFNDASVAGQTSDATQGLLTITGSSQLFMALAGYAVLDNVSIPIVGDPKTVNDSYIEQLTAGAKAAIDKAVEIGVTDPERVAVGGHSYGAFMTANLLAHTRLFKAGIARSGAYNRTLTPFGFQSERRTYWDATDLYTKISPFTYANAIKEPMLMIHGMADDNPGTFPIQSERMFAAIKGNGGTARLVMLPAEAHGYAARESTETVLAEMIAWLDKYVKNAPSTSMRAETLGR